MLGRCRRAGPQPQCETECAPGERECAFDGAGAERVCGATGLWMAEAACAAGTTCRLGGGVALGCVACVGPGAVGGNAFGTADSRCGPKGVESCGADNRWQADEPCLYANVCATLHRGPSTLPACQLL